MPGGSNGTNVQKVCVPNGALFTVSRVTIKTFAIIKRKTELGYDIILNHIFEYIYMKIKTHYEVKERGSTFTINKLTLMLKTET